MSFFGQKSATQSQVQVSYSNNLENIDGFLVTDGRQARMTLRATLSPQQKERGKAVLLRYLQVNTNAGVYTWRVTD